MVTCSSRKADAAQRTALNTDAGDISGSYSYNQEEATGTIHLESGSKTANVYLTQHSTTQVKISSTMFSSDAYFNLSVNFKPTDWSVGTGYTGYSYVGDLYPTKTSHYIKLIIGGNKYYFDCPSL